MMHAPKVSVIIPVYKAEEYIERCARSLFEQTLDSIEYIFVNDCTPDSSILILTKVLDDYPHRKSQVIVIDMPVNSKQAKARSVGLHAATGEYVIHCDPDDWVDLDYYESMYNKAKINNLDIVTASYILHSIEGISGPSLLPKMNSPFAILRSNRFFSLSLCFYLIKNEIIKYHEIDFYEGINYMEDYGFLARVLYYANSMGYVRETYYHYEKENSESITCRMNSSEIVEQRIKCLCLLDSFFECKGISKEKLGLSLLTKRDIKDLFLSVPTLVKWKSLFPEVARWQYKYAKAPYLFRFVYILAHKVGTWPMRMYLKIHDIIR